MLKPLAIAISLFQFLLVSFRWNFMVYQFKYTLPSPANSISPLANLSGHMLTLGESNSPGLHHSSSCTSSIQKQAPFHLDLQRSLYTAQPWALQNFSPALTLSTSSLSSLSGDTLPRRDSQTRAV